MSTWKTARAAPAKLGRECDALQQQQQRHENERQASDATTRELRHQLQDALKAVERLLTTVRRGSELTRRLLAFGRRQELRPERLDVPQPRGIPRTAAPLTAARDRAVEHLPVLYKPYQLDTLQLVIGEALAGQMQRATGTPQ